MSEAVITKDDVENRINNILDENIKTVGHVNSIVDQVMNDNADNAHKDDNADNAHKDDNADNAHKDDNADNADTGGAIRRPRRARKSVRKLKKAPRKSVRKPKKAARKSRRGKAKKANKTRK